MTRIAVLGAGGFIGNRTVELLHKGGQHDVVPVVRRPSALALTKRFALEGRIADALDAQALANAFTGCEAVVAAVAGPSATLIGMIAPLVGAARVSGIRRIIYLSSQMVHGQAPLPGTTEGSALPRRQPLAYNRAKAVAEKKLACLAAAARIELVVLRPGIVYGPRSRWTGLLADELLAGEAFLVSDLPAVCNAIYVDNLVHAIELAIDAPIAAGQALFVNDTEALRWRDIIEPIAAALGIDRDAIARPTLAEALRTVPSWPERQVLPIARWALRKLPKRVRQVLSAARGAARHHRNPAEPARKRYSREMALLQSCRVRLSDEKARNLLNYRPPISHSEGMRRSIAWMRFAGYPVQ